MNGEQRTRLEGIGSAIDVGRKDIKDVRKATLKGRLLKMTMGSVAAAVAIVVGFFTGETIRGPIVNPASTYPFVPALILTSISIDPRVNASILGSKLSPRRYTSIAIVTVAIVAFVGGLLIGAASPSHLPQPTKYGVASRAGKGQ